jgi:hypothetical protein
LAIGGDGEDGGTERLSCHLAAEEVAAVPVPERRRLVQVAIDFRPSALNWGV